MYPRSPAGRWHEDAFRAWDALEDVKKGNRSWMHTGTTRGSTGVRRQEVS